MVITGVGEEDGGYFWCEGRGDFRRDGKVVVI